MIISHRGNDKHNYKENTKKAIINCLKNNYVDGVEVDIRITKDKKLVLNHSFLCNNKIIKYTKKSRLNLDELNSLLKELNTSKYIIIDIKDNNIEIINLLYKTIKKYKKLNIYIQTFHKNLAFLFKHKYPNIKVGINIFSLKDIDEYKLLDFITIHYSNYKKTNKETFVWTVNKKELKKRFISTNIITDKPWIFK